jgi:hypothetical protein
MHMSLGNAKNTTSVQPQNTLGSTLMYLGGCVLVMHVSQPYMFITTGSETTYNNNE